MRGLALSLLVLGLGACAAGAGTMEGKNGLYTLQARALEGELVDLGDYAGGVALVVNLASQ